jgi:hypothetical protein
MSNALISAKPAAFTSISNATSSSSVAVKSILSPLAFITLMVDPLSSLTQWTPLASIIMLQSKPLGHCQDLLNLL